jgi:hypothetical protein
VDCTVCHAAILVLPRAEECARCHAGFHIACRKREGMGASYRDAADRCPRCGDTCVAPRAADTVSGPGPIPGRRALQLVLTTGSAVAAALGVGLVAAAVPVAIAIAASRPWLSPVVLVVVGSAACAGLVVTAGALLGIRLSADEVALPHRISHSRDPRF